MIMMSEKRFIKKDYDYDGCFFFDREQEFTDNVNKIPFYDVENLIPMTDEQVVELLNEQEQKIQLLEKVNEDLREVNKENQRLHEENVKQCERWRSLYELKDAEVTARVDALNKVCEYYTSEVLFKSDTDPNQAVKEVIKEILNTEVEM